MEMEKGDICFNVLYFLFITDLMKRIIIDDDFRTLNFPIIDIGISTRGETNIEKHWNSIWNPYNSFKILKYGEECDVQSLLEQNKILVFWEEILVHHADIKEKQEVLSSMKISDVVTSSTEAFCICTMINNARSFMRKIVVETDDIKTITREDAEIIKNKMKNPTDETKPSDLCVMFQNLLGTVNVETKFFTGPSATKGINNCIGGWSKTGIELYSYLHYTIKKFRQTDVFKELESNFLEKMNMKNHLMKVDATTNNNSKF